MIIKKHLLILFSTPLMLTGASLAPVMTAMTNENNIITPNKEAKEILLNEEEKSQSQDESLPPYLATNDFVSLWNLLMSEISKQKWETQIAIIKEIGKLHIDKVKNLKELEEIEKKILGFIILMWGSRAEMPTSKIKNSNAEIECLEHKFLNDVIPKFELESQDELIMNYLISEFVLTSQKIIKEIAKKTTQTQIKAIQEISNLLHNMDKIKNINSDNGENLKNSELYKIFNSIVQKLRTIHAEISKKP